MADDEPSAPPIPSLLNLGELPPERLEAWQEVADLAAKLIDVPAALIMRAQAAEIEVLVSSATTDNPYSVGDKEELWGSGLYCETVIKSGAPLLVPDALADPDWDANPDIELGMISYLGYPICGPGGEPFGTLCVLDRKENAYSETARKLLARFRDLVESELGLLCMNAMLQDENRKLADYIEELETLRRLIPICAWCHRVRSEGEYKDDLLDHLQKHVNVTVTHGLCPDCAKREFPRD